MPERFKEWSCFGSKIRVQHVTTLEVIELNCVVVMNSQVNCASLVYSHHMVHSIQRQ